MKSSIIEVIEPALTHDLTTLEIAKEELGITSDENDARLARWIRETSVYIERHCNRTLVRETVREVWHPGMEFNLSISPIPLTLRRFPVTEITSIVGASTDGEPLDPTGYEVDVYRGRLWRMNEGCRYWWWWSSTPLEVVYTGGYDAPDNVPPDLQAACVALLRVRNDMLGRDRYLRAEEVPGVLRQEWNNIAAPGQAALPPEVCEMLRPFQEFNS